MTVDALWRDAGVVVQVALDADAVERDLTAALKRSS